MNISLNYRNRKTCIWRVYNTVPNTKLQIVINNYKVISKPFNLIIYSYLKIYTSQVFGNNYFSTHPWNSEYNFLERVEFEKYQDTFKETEVKFGWKADDHDPGTDNLEAMIGELSLVIYDETEETEDYYSYENDFYDD